MRLPLSDDLLKSLAADPGQLNESLPTYIWDTNELGLGVRLLKTGRLTFVYKRTVNKDDIWDRFGPYPKINLAQATELAAKNNLRIEDGRKPRERKLIPKRWGPLVDKFEKEHCKGLKAKTIENYKSLFRSHIRPAFIKKFAHEVTDSDVRDRYFSMSDMPRQANVWLGKVRAIFERAEGWGHIELMSNPVVLLEKQKMKTFVDGVRDRKIEPDEMDRLAVALQEMDEEGWHQFVAIFKTTYFSGARIGEVLSMEWESINLEKEEISWLDTKGGPTKKVLTDALFTVLRGLPRHEGSPYVFPSLDNSESGHVVDIKRPWKKLLEKARVTNLTRHDLRHNFGDEAADQNLCLQAVAALLGQRHATSAERYTKTSRTANARNAKKVSNRLSQKL